MQAYKVGGSTIHGRGVFARRALRDGEAIGLLRGRAARRPGCDADGRIYAIEREGGGFLVPNRPAGLGFFDHSCDANAEMRLTTRGGRLVALRRIRRGEEVTCDYRPSLHNGRRRCRCGAHGCSGRI